MIIKYAINPDAVEVLRKVQLDVPEAIVAGGAIRDWMMGRPVNDIDVFVPDDKVWLAAKSIRDTHPNFVKSVPEPYLVMNADIRTVRYYEGDGAPPVNIIGVSGDCTPEAQLSRFDYGICRVGFDGERLWKDLAFDRDVRDQTFSLMQSTTKKQREHSMKRFDRLVTKYPGWKFVDRSPYGAPGLFG